MRTHTTYTDMRRIMKFHTDGYTPEQICEEVFIDVAVIKKIIDVKFKKKGKKAEV